MKLGKFGLISVTLVVALISAIVYSYAGHSVPMIPKADASGNLLAVPVTLQNRAVDDETTLVDNQPAPDFSVKDINGNVVRLSSFHGKVVLLNFWGVWCPPCLLEIPDLVTLQKQYAGQGLQIIGVAMDEEGLSKVKPFVQNSTINYPVLIGDNSIAAKYGEMNAIPVTFLIDRNGVIREKFIGRRLKSVFESALLPLLKEK